MRRRTTLAAGVALTALAALGMPVLGPATPALASFDVEAQWTDNEYVVATDTATAPKAANLEALPDGRLIAVLLARGDDYGFAAETVLVSRVREATGTWSAPQVTPTGAPWSGTGAPEGRTFDTFADSSGRVLVVWAVRSATSGQWPVMSVSRTTAGTWSAPQEVYVAKTDGAYGDSLEIGFITPRLVPVGDTVTLAWSTTTAVSNGSIDTSTNPFRARRWTAGTWGSEIASSGYGAAGQDVAPLAPDSTRVQADPGRAVRASDGRISFVYTLVKHRTIRTIAHPLNPVGTSPGDVNVANVWDGVPETDNAAHTETAWVVHLDPGSGSWSAPMKLVRSGHVPTSCVTNLPTNPPLVAHWAEWKTASAAGELSTGCGYAEESKRPSAYYDSGGDLQITLDHRSGPSSTIVLNQFLDKACDDPGATNSTRFCLDDWGTPAWAVTWNDAGLRIEAGNDQPGLDAIQQTPAPFPAQEFTVATTAGNVRVVEAQGTGGKSILFDRASGTDVTWNPDPSNATGDEVDITHVFVDDGDVAVFYTYGTESGGEGCGLGILLDGHSTVDHYFGCVSGSLAQVAQRDVVQLTDGRLARIDGYASQTPVRLFAVTDQPTTPPPPPVPSVTAPAAVGVTTAGSHTVRWNAVPGASYDVRMRRAAWNGSFGGLTQPAAWQGLGTTSVTHALPRGSTTCYSVRARNSGGTSGWSSERCMVAPLDQTSLARSAGWTVVSGGAYYGGSAALTNQQARTLARTGASLRRVGVVATTCPTCGVVDLYVGAQRVGRIRLARGTAVRHRQVLLVPAFSARSGKVRVVVASRNRAVRIDGLVVAAR
ncbi:hypothetical protein ACFQ0K_09915 [Nocardioides caeni]|uniref:hypothetical protein n=1 Tax=Nocardioides caeni TaxID=574700 RepID=UPI0031F0C94B